MRDYYDHINDSYYFDAFADRQHVVVYSKQRLVDHLDNMIARIVSNDENVLKELLTSRTFFIKGNQFRKKVRREQRDDFTDGFNVSSEYYIQPEVNAVYNHAHPDSWVVGDVNDRWVDLPRDERAGVLTHPAWLAAHGDAFENGPSIIHRGKWVREQLLCDELPALPITVDAQLDPETVDLSARERVASATETDPACLACHQMMNPLGYPFEIYNHAGFLREDDHGLTPDGSAILAGLPRDIDIPEGTQITDAIDYMELLAESKTVQLLYSANVPLFVGRDETLNDALAARVAYEDSDGSFKEML